MPVGKYIILGILGLLVLLFLAPAGVEVLFRREVLTLRLRVLWVFSIPILPRKEESLEKTRRAKKKKAPEQAKKQKKPAPSKDPLERVMEVLCLINDLLPHAGRFLGRVLRGITLSRCRVALIVSGEEAADAGIATGRAYALAYGAYSILQRYIRVREFTFNVLPDFLSGKGAADAEVTLRTRPITLLAAGAALLFQVMKTLLAGRGKPSPSTQK